MATIRQGFTNNTAATIAGTISALAILFYFNVKSSDRNRKKKYGRNNDYSKSKKPLIVNKGTTTYRKENTDEEWLEHMPQHIQRVVTKERRRREKMVYLAMKSPMYDNIQMIDPNGATLPKISRKKAEWYVKKGLAHYCTHPEDSNGTKNDSMKCIQINFEPKNNSITTIYQTSEKENICVKCGRGDYHLMRHHIVPSTYKSLLPKKYKSHMSHDITLLCGDCHLHCQQSSQKRMNDIENLCRPPGSAPKYTNDNTMYKARSSALALLNWSHKIPKDQLKIHYQRVKDFLVDERSNDPVKDLQCDDSEFMISSVKLQELIDAEYLIENPDFIPGNKLVVESIIDDEKKIAQFVRDWRKHFIDTVHPRFLPEGWSVDHDVTSKSP
jgi:hypothetical protein